MNVEGDYRYVESGAFAECADFMDYLVDCDYDWNEAFVSWNSVSERWKEDRRTSHGYWGHLNIVKVFDVMDFVLVFEVVDVYLILFIFMKHILHFKSLGYFIWVFATWLL